MGTASEKDGPRAPSRARAWLTVVCSLLVGLFLAEHAAAAARGNAFPFLDVFEPDAELGVRLRAGAETRIRTFGGHATDVAINREGFRGDWPTSAAPSTGQARVLLVGDSQVFGLHSQFEETFAGLLGADAEVLDAAVPTYGPGEHVTLIERLAPRWHPTHVVWLPYVGNDWQEAPIPNVQRTTATPDGFATMVGARPPSGPWNLFPRSHLAFALRRVVGRALEAAPPRAEARLRLISQASELRSGASASTRLDPFLVRAVEAARATGAELVVAVIPVDVQADPSEWQKYHHEPVDTAALSRLTADLVLAARARGAVAIDLLDPLRAAEPGAFLADDEHLSPNGHRAVADALRAAMFSPRPRADGE